MPPKLDRNLMEQLMFGTGRVRRFTQDSPILPDVWLEYVKELDAEATFPPVKLLLTPFREASAGDVRREILSRLREQRETAEWQAFGHAPEPLPRVAYNQTTVAATLYFEDLIRAVLPMTDWWVHLDQQLKLENVQSPGVQESLADAVQDPEHSQALPTGRAEEPFVYLPPALLWMIRVAGTLALVQQRRPLPPGFLGKNGIVDATKEDWKIVVKAAADLIRGVELGDPTARIYSVNLNREATPTISRSTLAVKADAARLLFNISCSHLAWAIVDCGVDARHPAFRKRTKDGEAYEKSFQDDKGKIARNSRVVETYDFTQIDLLLDPDTPEWPEPVRKILAGETTEAEELRQQLEELKNSLSNGRTLDWKIIAPLLRVPHEEGKYVPPGMDHGTHVAGILASDWKSKDPEPVKEEEDLVGVCPDLRLYDLRVLNAEGRGDEFAVMAALQFIRYLNGTNDFMVVHGANLSLSIPHDISNYACGRTPVCDECERLVSSAVVVVAAAGNQGYRKYSTAEGGTTEAYNSISITDPGNAELILTVGATHRYRPHTYGVSYFSSRGPTGDGRSKPDLVAPGEKITAPLPGGLYGLKDGTSMAAPHVSGAAALLMARYNELVGQPARIKQILCSTATDLGRERYFQGAGMLDTLRALQSV
jgi:serine protease AprX